MEIGFAVREPLGERKRVAGLHEDMESPACDLFALVLVVFGDLGHVAPGHSSFYRRTLPVEVGWLTRERSEPLLGARDRLVDPAGDLREPLLEGNALGLLLGGERGQALAEVRLDLPQTTCERGHELLSLPIEAGGHLRELLLEPNAADVP